MYEGSLTPEQLSGSDTTDRWWLWSVLGALSIVAGILVLVRPGDSLATLSVIMGIFILVDGIFEVVSALHRHTDSRAIAALMGVVGIVVGILLIRHPFTGVAAAALMVGIWLVASGAVRLAWAVMLDRRVWNFVVGALQVVAGIVIVSTPGIGVTTLAVLVGISFLLYGAVLVALGWALRSVPR